MFVMQCFVQVVVIVIVTMEVVEVVVIDVMNIVIIIHHVMEEEIIIIVVGVVMIKGVEEEEEEVDTMHHVDMTITVMAVVTVVRPWEEGMIHVDRYPVEVGHLHHQVTMIQEIDECQWEEEEEEDIMMIHGGDQ